MSIQWFPGHMNAARKKAAARMANIDVVIEVVDARLPHASRNPMIHQLRRHRQRPALLVLNKADIADPQRTRLWLTALGRETDLKSVALSSKRAADLAQITTLCLTLAPHRGTPEKPLRMMIMGVPNVGKSTIMNGLLKRRVAAVGDEPAITKQQQMLSINSSLMLVDTPGLLWPKIQYPQDGLKLAAAHSVGRNAYLDEEVAVFLGDYLLSNYPQLLVARYGIALNTVLDGSALLDAIAQQRGYKRKGDTLDLEKAALALLFDYRTGTIGRISLETPSQVAAMHATPAAETPLELE